MCSSTSCFPPLRATLAELQRPLPANSDAVCSYGSLTTRCQDASADKVTLLLPQQRLPPVLRDNRFSKDTHRRVYISDQCNAHVPWSGQAKTFDGAYMAYDNTTPIEFLPQQWERGKDFRWFCTMCYGKRWDDDDLSRIRQRIGLRAKVD